MTLGFTKSKVDSNIHFKVEGRIPVMLLLYVDVLLFIGEDIGYSDVICLEGCLNEKDPRRRLFK